MPVRLVAKRSGAANVVPKPEELEEGELALNTADGVLFTKLASGEVRRLNQSTDTQSIEDRVADLEERLDSLAGEDGLVEYGQWVPSISVAGGTVVLPSITYDIQYGLYCRVGTMVTLNGRVRFTSTGGSGTSLLVNGLPFPHAITQNSSTYSAITMQGAGSCGFAGGASGVKPLYLWGAGSSYAAWLGKLVDGTGDETSIAYFSPADCTGLLDLVFNYTYHTTDTWQV